MAKSTSAFRVATWNIQRPARNPYIKGPSIQRVIDHVGADVWVLTETRENFAPAPHYFAVHSERHPYRGRDDDERWASIWSCWSLESVWRDKWSVTALVNRPQGQFLVHGVVLPYMNEPANGGNRAAGWGSRFREELGRQSRHWVELRATYPHLPIVMAGDLNQTLIPSRGRYGSARDREMLLRAFAEAGLKCVTAELLVQDPVVGQKPMVDHICISDGLSRFAQRISWQPRSPEGRRLSDHHGVAVDLFVDAERG